MKLTTYIITSLFLLLFSYQAHSQTEETESVHSIEIDAAIWAPMSSSNSNLNVFSTVFQDTIAYYANNNFTPEIRFKYLRKIHKNISLFSGIYLGAQITLPSVSLREEQLIFGTSGFFGGSSESEYHDLSPIAAKYITIPLGARATGYIFKNDRVNFSIGPSFTLYPKQKLERTEQIYSQFRNETLIVTSETSLDTKAKLATGFDFDLNYQLVTKKERFSLVLGILINKNNSQAFTLDTSIATDDFSFPMNYSFRSSVFGAYIGSSFVIGE